MQKILVQLDTDQHPSVFDRVVAVDAGVEQLFSYGAVTPDAVEALVHGVMFTRGPQALLNSAVFVGGSDVAAGEQLFERVQQTFFGPVRVSVMMDSNGSNTTAAAAVLAARQHVNFEGASALILGGTGPVGLRAAQLLARRGVHVRLASRSLDRAAVACELIKDGQATPVSTGSDEDAKAALADVQILIAAGAAGVQFFKQSQWSAVKSLKVAIDVNAVPPVGLEGIDVMDRAVDRAGIACYGAIGVGGTKMKIHKTAIRRLFESNSAVLDTEAIYQLGEQVIL